MSRIKNETPPPEPDCCCPDRQRPGDLKRVRKRDLQAFRGTTEVIEPEYCCKKCRRSFFPPTQWIRVEPDSKLSPGLMAKVVHAASASSTSFEQARENLGVLTEADVSAKRIGRLVTRIGRRTHCNLAS